MPSREQTIQIYHELADCYDRQGDSRLRDIYLTLAADTATKAGRPDEAERLRAFLLDLNPHHLLGTHGSFAEALQSPDVAQYLEELRLKHPVEVAQEKLDAFWDMPTLGGEQHGYVPPTMPEDEAPPSRPRLPIDLGPAPTVAPLRVYNLLADAEEKQPPRPRADQPARRDPPVPKPAPAAPQRAPSVPARPAAPRPTRAVGTPPSPASQVPPAPAPVPAAPRKAISRPPAEPARSVHEKTGTQPPGENEDVRGGAWIATGLFLLLVLGAGGMLILTLGRPFFPADWMP